MAKFTDRKEELESFQEKFRNLKKGELIILYGRRRVGKTELVRKFMEELPKESRMYSLIDEGTPMDMLRSVSEDATSAWPETRVDFKSWEEFFSFLGERAKKQKTVAVIDEFQRMRSDPRALTRFQKAWDTELKGLPIMVVFLGSAVGAIHRIAISGRAPLFGRATGRFQLKAFDYQCFRQALGKIKDERMILKNYATFGGMPSYLEFAEQCTEEKSHLETVEKHVLEKTGILRDEPQALLRMELKDTGRYNSILAAIAAGHRNLKEISDQTGIKPSVLGFYLNKLEKSLEIIKKTSPLCGKHRPQYVFRDNFFAFWYNFVFRNLSALEIGHYGHVKERVRAELPIMEGRIFEEVVKELLAKYNGKEIKGKKIDFPELGSWWGRKEGDIDILGASKEGLLLGEAKWTSEPVGAAVARELEQRVGFLNCTQAQRSNVTFLIASKSGFEPSAHKYMDERGILGLDLGEITKMYDALPKK